MPSFRLTDNAGAPLAGAGPSFLAYVDRLGSPRVQPPIQDHGGGLYSFLPSPADISDGVGYLIDCGAGANPARGGGFVGNAHVFFPGYDAAGDLSGALTPAITLYVSAAGAPIVSAPAIDHLGGGLYAFTPTASDRLVGARFAIDFGAPAGPSRYAAGDVGDGLVSPDPGPPTPPGPVDFSASSNTAAPTKRALFFDPQTLTFPRLNGGMIHLTGRESIAQAVRVRLSTLRGEWWLAINRGLPMFDQILVKAPDTRAIEQTIRAEIESVPGIKTVKTMSLDLNRNARTLKVKWIADSDFGEIESSDLISS